nr:uncharacterized protein LOC124813516 [Hydra vulgaris]
MKKMKEIVQQSYPNILMFGCAAHLMNLVEKDVTPQTVLKHIVEVQKYFRNVHQPHGWLKAKKGLMPQLPNESRWNSQAECVRTFTSNYHLYLEIQTEHTEHFNDSIKKILDHVGIFREATQLVKQLDAVAATLNKLQADTTKLSDCVDIWLDIIENPDLENYGQFFRKRFLETMQPFHYLAYMLDPRKKGNRRLTMEQQNE